MKEVFPGTCRGVCIKRVTNLNGAWHKRRYNAFTLIELIVVVGIIIVLSGLVLSTVGYARKKGARARAETEIAAMSAACENYKADNAVYPRDSGSGSTDGLDPSTTGMPRHLPNAVSLHIRGNFGTHRNFDGTPDTNARPYMAFKETSLLRADMSNPPSSGNASNCNPRSIWQ